MRPRYLNNSKLSLYNDSQRDKLPTLGRKLSEYLTDTGYKYVRKTEPKQPKKLVGFALTRAPGSEWRETREKLGYPFTDAVARAPIE